LATDRVFLTGATGFVGSHILRELLAAGYTVRALVRGDAQPPAVAGLFRSDKVETVAGDMRRPGEFARSLDGCRYVVHAAALYSFAARDRASIAAVNIAGTESLMMAAHVAGVERAVLTSSSATLGSVTIPHRPERSERSRRGAYHESKVDQERVAFASQVPVVALLPTAPVGPGDWKPTPTGKLVLDFLRGKITAKAPGHGGMNLVAVEDVARAHVAALERGRPGERYVVGGENLSMDAIWQMLADVIGRPMPRWRVPYALAVATAYADELRCRIDPSATPFVPLEGVRMSRERMYADSSKAMQELGFTPSSVRSALERAVAWHRDFSADS
jgi:dihydroflavonol-4-reductase